MTKKAFFLVAAGTIILACMQSAESKLANLFEIENKNAFNSLLTVADAGKILGEPARLTDSSSKHQGGMFFQCVYKADDIDLKSSKQGALYFLIEKYSEISAAQKKYSSIKKANENHEGIKTLNGLGDEAYFHSDNTNFYFVMVRKGAVVFNMKVNKITSKTSLDSFNTVTRQITDSI
jgi:hypothetical protein